MSCLIISLKFFIIYFKTLVKKSSSLKEIELNFNNFEVAIICLLEINEIKHIHFSDFYNYGNFEERITQQFKKFKKLGIEIKTKENDNNEIGIVSEKKNNKNNDNEMVTINDEKDDK